MGIKGFLFGIVLMGLGIIIGFNVGRESVLNLEKGIYSKVINSPEAMKRFNEERIKIYYEAP